MSTVIKTIKDFFGNIVYPITKTNAVYDSNNNRLDNILASKQDASSNFVYKGTGSAVPSIDDPELRQSDISTTQSTSDTKVPSSSLVKTMNDNLGNPSSASAVTGADAFSKINKLNSDLAEYQKLKTICDFSANGTYNFTYNIANYNEFIISMTLNSQLRQTVLICDYAQLTASSGVFPDFMTSDGRVYCRIKAISATQYTVSDLSGLSNVGATAAIKIMAR